MTDFSIGDRVRCVKDIPAGNAPGVLVGQEGEVESYDDSIEFPLGVLWDAGIMSKRPYLCSVIGDEIENIVPDMVPFSNARKAVIDEMIARTPVVKVPSSLRLSKPLDSSPEDEPVLVSGRRICRTREEAEWYRERFDAILGGEDLPEYKEMRDQVKSSHERLMKAEAHLFQSKVYYREVSEGIDPKIMELFVAIDDFYKVNGYFPTGLIKSHATV